MSGVALKIGTLAIRTIAKPIATRLKAQAREHEGFRRICVGWAQMLHRVDMRLRLGLLQDPAALERQAAREAADAAKKKLKAETPTVRTEAQMKADEAAAKKEGDKSGEHKKAEKPKIKPLSEAKAIDMGANFIAESFLFAVAVGTVLFDYYRSKKKDASRRNDVADKLAELEARDDEKNKRIEEMERVIRGIQGHEHWKWPWSRENTASHHPASPDSKRTGKSQESQESQGTFQQQPGSSSAGPQGESPEDHPKPKPSTAG